MTADQLKSLIMTDIDRVFNLPKAVTWWLSADSKRVLHAQRFFWQAADEATLQKLLDYFEKES